MTDNEQEPVSLVEKLKKRGVRLSYKKGDTFREVGKNVIIYFKKDSPVHYRENYYIIGTLERWMEWCKQNLGNDEDVQVSLCAPNRTYWNCELWWVEHDGDHFAYSYNSPTPLIALLKAILEVKKDDL